jgi:ankyrin repeat protein
MNQFERLIEAARWGDIGTVRAILDTHAEFTNQRDASGATALHYAAFAGNRPVVQELVRRGADINARDTQFDATPAGWAIEYLRERGGLLAIELSDMAHAIKKGEVEWVRRFLGRLPAFREACDLEGKPFKLLAQQSGNQEIAQLFSSTATNV